MSKKSVVVVGAGLQGQPLAWALSKLNFDVNLIDSDYPTLRNAVKKIAKLGFNIKCDYSSFSEVKQADLIVSAAPFLANIHIATHCEKNHIRYCDLGGNPEVSKLIHHLANKSKFTVCTDLGLAPGWVNLIAESGCAALKNDLKGVTILMKVGGLPVNPKGSLKYGRTFNVKGLINEYQGQCDILEDGQIKQVGALGDLESIYIGEIDESFESFNTRGGITPLTLLDLQERGVRNCNYQTLRYPGHCNLLSFLMQECNVSDLESALSNACPVIFEDRVIISVILLDQNKKRIWSKVIQINYDDHWTAMQKATAFPAACAAAQIARGQFDAINVLKYRDFDLSMFHEDLAFLDYEMPHRS